MRGKTDTLKAEISRNEQLIVIFEVILYKVTKQTLSDQAEDHTASCTGPPHPPNSDGKDKPKGEKKKINEERNHNRMIEVVCEG